MSRVEETKKIINAHSSLRGNNAVFFRIEELLENIALNLAELNDRLEKREDGHIRDEH